MKRPFVEGFFQWEEFWSDILKKQFKIGTCIIEFDENNKKLLKKIKNLEGTSLDNCHNIGKEIFIGYQNAFFLDIDFKDKSKQKEMIHDNEELIEFLKKTNFYVESTCNYGLHILLIFDGSAKLNNIVNIEKYVLKSEEEELVIEFKKNCLVYPSTNYKIVNLPSDVTEYPVCNYESLNYFLKKIVELIYRNNDSVIKIYCEKLMKKFSLDIKDDIELEQFYKKIDNKKQKIDDKNDNSNNWDVKKIVSDNDTDSEDNEDNYEPNDNLNNDQKNEGQKQFEDDEEDECDDSNRNGGNYDSEIFKSKKIMNILANNDKDLDEKEIAKIINKAKPDILNRNKILCLIDKKYKPVIVDRKLTCPYDESIRSYREKILANIGTRVFCNQYKDRELQILADGLLKSICILEDYLNKNLLYQIYGDNIKLFLEWMMMADYGEQIDKYNFNSIFSDMSDFNLWYRWTLSYCSLINFLEENYVTTGTNSRSSIDDYKMYRSVTKLNHVGASHSEEFERREYCTIKAQVKNKTDFLFFNSAAHFFYFILNTLASIKLNIKSIVNFDKYVTFFTGSKLEMELDFMNDVLFNIYFKKLRFLVQEIENDSNNGNMTKTSYIWFEGYYWQKIESKFFENLIKKLLPNFRKVDLLIEKISTKMYYETDYNLQFKKWKMIFPFLNGVFDFSLNNNSTNVAFMIGEEPIVKQKTSSDYSLFRNYKFTDGVTQPINKSFSIRSYLRTFKTTSLLSLDNFERYSAEFCYFIRGTFGNNAEEGLFRAYNYQNLICFFINLAIGILRTNQNQNCTIMQGKKGANGKSKLIEFLELAFGSDKFSTITSKTFFHEKDINQQAMNLQETMCLYDHEASVVSLQKFKEHICGGANTSRGLFKNVDRENNFIYAHYIFACNNGIRYINYDNPYGFDEAFLRRCFVIKFFNNFQKKDDSGNTESLLFKKGIDLSDSITKNRIVTGLVFYIFDIIHVFELASLNSTISNYITCPMANKRVIGNENFNILKFICEKYAILSEIYNENFKNMQSEDVGVDLRNIISDYKDKKNIKDNIDVMQIKNILKESFGIKITEYEEELNPNNNTYYLNGLKSKERMTKMEKDAHEFPNWNYLEKMNISVKENLSDKDYFEFFIPIDQRFKVHPRFEKKYYGIMRNLLDGNFIESSIVPKISETYVDTVIEDIWNVLRNDKCDSYD